MGTGKYVRKLPLLCCYLRVSALAISVPVHKVLLDNRAMAGSRTLCAADKMESFQVIDDLTRGLMLLRSWAEMSGMCCLRAQDVWEWCCYPISLIRRVFIYDGWHVRGERQCTSGKSALFYGLRTSWC